jgi:hypothetical protein
MAANNVSVHMCISELSFPCNPFNETSILFVFEYMRQTVFKVTVSAAETENDIHP